MVVGVVVWLPVLSGTPAKKWGLCQSKPCHPHPATGGC